MIAKIQFIVAAIIGIVVGGIFATLQQNSSIPHILLTLFAFVCATTLTVLALRLVHSGALDEARSALKKTSFQTKESTREQGVVKWFNFSKGFGFITRDNGEDIFVHFRSIEGSGDGKRGLREGQRVEFNVSEGEKGLQADDVVILPRQ